MRIKILGLLVIALLGAAGLSSCQKSTDQALRDLEASNVQKYAAKYFQGVKPTQSGLYFKQIQPGYGTDSIKTGDVVKVFYSGFLIENNDSLGIKDGAQFDGTGDYEPFTFTVGGGTVLSGWDEAIRLMKEGEKAWWMLPSRIAYSSQPQSSIPAYSPLVFYVTVVKVYPPDYQLPVESKMPPK